MLERCIRSKAVPSTLLHLCQSTCYGNSLVTNTVTRLSAGLMMIIIPHLSCHHNVQPAMRKQIQCFENQLIDQMLLFRLQTAELEIVYNL